MAGGGGKSDERGRGGTPDDADLWSKVAGTARPLKRGKDRLVPGASAPEEPAAKPDEPNRRTPPEVAPGPKREPKTPPAPPPLGGFDRREEKLLAGGRLPIEARIDLHGMRQSEAHGALKAFLARAHARGHRHVLVITGKGGPKGPESIDPFSDRDGGVLRREVPRWLGEPEFRRWVVGFTSAAPRHGGDGALYVRLRRADRRPTE